MRADKETILIIVCAVVVFTGMFSVMTYELHAKRTCKELAIAHDMPYLEIKELCQ